jgi:anti-sigma regulatory factor (Ser/Thr protein kinase)
MARCSAASDSRSRERCRAAMVRSASAPIRAWLNTRAATTDPQKLTTWNDRRPRARKHPRRLRHTVRDLLGTVDGPPEVLEDFLMAVDEMTSNAVRHGTPPAGLRLWIAPGRLVCTIRDSGHGLDDPFAGYGPAHGEDLSNGGMGLWLARQLCDHVAIRRDERGVSVRLSTSWR